MNQWIVLFGLFCVFCAEATADGLPLQDINAQYQEKLDSLWAQDAGRIPPPLPAPVSVLPDTSMAALPPPQRLPGMSKSEYRSRLAVYRASELDRLNAVSAKKNSESALKLGEFVSAAKKVCNENLTDGPAVGMSDEYFRDCTKLARFTSPTNLIDTEENGVPLRLYVYDTNQWQRIYVAAHVIIAIVNQSLNTQTPLQPQAGLLHTIGSYPESYYSPMVVPIGGGEFFVYGRDPEVRWNTPDGQAKLANYHSGNSMEPPPMQWDKRKKGWKKLPYPPECPVAASFYTATLLPDRRILIAGGLCKEPRMTNDPNPYSEYKKLSIWNSEKLAWEAAPELGQGRFLHSASLLQDGSVLIAGGRKDPGVTEGQPAALNSVELYAKGKVLPLQPMSIARARHTAAVLKDGSVLVLGGADDQDNAIASAERYMPASNSWHSVASMHQPRFDHTATLLDDGRVMVVGGVGEQNQVLNSVEIFDPSTESWTRGPALPEYVRTHSAIGLANGDVVVAGGSVVAHTAPQPWIYLLPKGADHWSPAGLINPDDLAYHPVMDLDGNGLTIFGSKKIFHWEEKTGQELHPAPLWSSQPAETILTGDRVMVVGQVNGLAGRWESHIWNRATNSWSFAGQPNFTSPANIKAITLPSDRVLVIANTGPMNYATGQRDLECEIWLLADLSWKNCGAMTLQYPSDAPVGLQVLADGRVVMVPNGKEAFIYDDKQSGWTARPVEWSNEALTYGDAVHTQKPLARIYDDQSQQWLDISESASRNMQAVDETPASSTVPNFVWRALGPAMIRDAAKNRWVYVFPHGKMGGRHAAILPDGCVLSWPGFKLYNPITGLVRDLQNIAQNVSANASDMVVLSDGTVVIAGVANGGSELGGGFFVRKASCIGFEPSAEDNSLMTAAWAQDTPPQAALTALTPETARKENFWGKWRNIPVESLRILLGVLVFSLAVLGIRQAMLKWISAAPAGNKQGSMKSILTHEIPSVFKPFSWFWRVVLMGVFLLMVMRITGNGFLFELWRSNTACANDPAQCLDPKTKLLSRELSVPGMSKLAEPVIPCQYVGAWSWRNSNWQNGKVVLHYTLNDDGTYVIKDDTVMHQQYIGYWAVQGNYMIWRSKSVNTGKADVNKIVSGDKTHFGLIEMDGGNTQFELIQAANSSKCAR